MLTNMVGCIEKTPSVATLTESSGDSLKGPFFMSPPTFALGHASFLCVSCMCVCAFVNSTTDGSESFSIPISGTGDTGHPSQLVQGNQEHQQPCEHAHAHTFTVP